MSKEKQTLLWSFFCLKDDVSCFDGDKMQVFLRVGQNSPDFTDSTLSPHGSGNECLLTLIGYNIYIMIIFIIYIYNIYNIYI